MFKVIEMSNHTPHLSEVLGRSKNVTVSKSGKAGVAFLVKILFICLIFVPGVWLIECSSCAAGDQKLTTDKPLKISTGVGSQLEFVCDDTGKETNDKSETSEADTDVEFDIWHSISIWFLYFTIGFLIGYIPSFYEILKSYRKGKKLNRQIDENFKALERKILQEK